MVAQSGKENLAQTPATPRRWRRAMVMTLGCASLVFGWSCFTMRERSTDHAANTLLNIPHHQNQDSNAGIFENRTSDTESASPSDPDAAYRQMVLGSWEDDYHGKRYLTLREDGTAEMLVEPAGVGKLLVAPQLRFNVEWKVEHGKLHMKTLGGEPEAKVNMVLRIYGNQVAQPIQQLTADRMILLDEDGTTKYEWRRR